MATTQVEGRIHKNYKQDGRYDMILQVWDKTGIIAGKARLVQTIRISRVNVVSGEFKVFLNAGLEAHFGKELFFEVKARPFEVLQPFQPGEISRVATAAF